MIFLFLEVISKDRKLLSVNLSWNRVMDPEPSVIASILDPNVANKRKHMGGQFTDLSR